MKGENFETICILTKALMDKIGGMGKGEVGVHSFPPGFLHNPSILKIKILSEKKTDFSIPANGFLGCT